MPGDRQPLAEFDDLFRSEPGTAPADATQQMPPVSGGARPGSHGGGQRGPQGPHDQSRAERRANERKRVSPAVIIGIVVAACAIAGLAAGAALSSGGGAEKTDEVPAGNSSADEDESSSADGAAGQAKALEALLADSNNSRRSVITAVGNIKTCTSLGAAASDLRAAATQRDSLVTRLGKMSVDQLPDHAALTTSLNSAWKASASADSHYAAWADQVAAKKGCHKGKARSTGQTAAGNRASGDATTAKKKAAGIWNGIAKQYGLTERQYGQL